MEHAMTKTHVLHVIRDEYAGNPRSNADYLGTFAMFHRRYAFGDEKAKGLSIEEARRIESSPDYIALPVFMYDHSGTTIRTTPFSCPWDSGQIGIIFVPKAQVREEFGVKRISPKLVKRVLEALRSEIAELDEYLTGNVYGYKLYTCYDDGAEEALDSCWGFYGSDPEKNGMADNLPVPLSACEIVFD